MGRCHIYIGMKSQIEDVFEENNAILADLLKNTIAVHADNPSSILAKEFKSDHPLFHLLDKIGVKSLLETINLINPDKAGKITKTLLAEILKEELAAAPKPVDNANAGKA